MKRIAMFTDIHGNLPALEAIFSDLEREKLDDIYYLGDMIGFGPNSKECIDMFIGSTIKAVKGNHEVYHFNKEQFDNHLTPEEQKHQMYIHNELNEKEITFLEKLPMKYEVLIDGKLYSFNHFFLNKNETYYEPLTILGGSKQFEVAKEQDVDYMFIGHSHDPFQLNIGSVITCLGSSGCTKTDKTFYTIVEIDKKNIKMYRKELTYNRNKLIDAFKEKDYPLREKYADIFFGISNL